MRKSDNFNGMLLECIIASFFAGVLLVSLIFAVNEGLFIILGGCGVVFIGCLLGIRHNYSLLRELYKGGVEE